MIRAADPGPTAGASPASGRPAGYSFRRPGLLVRVWPFAVIAGLAGVSLALPPGPVSTRAVVASVVPLMAVVFVLSWPRLPGWLPVLVPLAYTGSVLALILAAGTTSGVVGSVSKSCRARIRPGSPGAFR